MAADALDGDGSQLLRVLERVVRSAFPRWAMSAAAFGTVDKHEVEILQSRLDELLEAGYGRDDAVALSSHRDVDFGSRDRVSPESRPHWTAARILL